MFEISFSESEVKLIQSLLSEYFEHLSFTQMELMNKLTQYHSMDSGLLRDKTVAVCDEMENNKNVLKVVKDVFAKLVRSELGIVETDNKGDVK